MTGPSKAMKAAFPPKLSEGAARLRDVICAVPTWMSSDPHNQKQYDYHKGKETAQAIVTELGITPEMVEVLKRLDGDLRHNSFKAGGDGPESAAGEVAHALSTLLEVAGQ